MLLSLNTPIKDKIRMTHPVLGETLVHLVYEKLGRVCMFCGELGHDLNGCAARTRLARIKNKKEYENRSDLKDILKPTLGSWINSPVMIPDRVEGQGSRSNEEQQPPGSTGQKRSRDDVLRIYTRKMNQNPIAPITDLSLFHGNVCETGELSFSSLSAKKPKPTGHNASATHI